MGKYTTGEITSTTPPELTIHGPHWFENRAIQFSQSGRSPATIKEWVRCIWNADIFFGKVPVGKTVILINEIIFWSIQLLIP